MKKWIQVHFRSKKWIWIHSYLYWYISGK